MKYNGTRHIFRIKTSMGSELNAIKCGMKHGFQVYQCFDIETGQLRGYVGQVESGKYGPLCADVLRAATTARNMYSALRFDFLRQKMK